MSGNGQRRSATTWIAATLLLVLASVPLLRIAYRTAGRATPPVVALSPAKGDAEVKARVEAAASAAQQFLAKAGESFRDGSPPRATDAAVAPLLARVFDVDPVVSKKLSPDDALALVDWLEADVQVGSVYALAGTGISDMSKVPDDPKILAQIDRNVATYAPEVGRFMDTMVTIDGLMAQSLATSNGDDPNTKRGTDLVRAGMALTIGGALRTIAGRGLDGAWRRDRILVLLQMAPKLATFLTRTQCSEIRKRARQIGPALHAPDAEKELVAFRTALTC